MKPSVVFPFHDPDGVYFKHLRAILPALKQTFSAAIISIPPGTAANWPDNLRWLQEDGFFKVYLLPGAMPVGAHFFALFEHAAAVSETEQVLHLCFIDRLAFALQSRHQAQFLRDVVSVTAADTPLIFQRSQAAWRTHPRNYAEIEGFATTVGDLLFGDALDFCWCHLAAQAGWLRRILPSVQNTQNNDMSMMAELILLGRGGIRTQDVDWLEWEDPFYAPEDAAELKRQREASAAETEKRLNYVIPMIQRIIAHAKEA